jgi:flagellar hook-basal body complex protein FliE
VIFAMSPISPISSPLASLASRIAAPNNTPPILPGSSQAGAPGAAPAGQGFAKVLDQLVGTVESKQTQANDITRNVLVGDQGQLHQSVIAMQEASVAFSLMVEVRNKLVDSYQEIMRMPV